MTITLKNEKTWTYKDYINISDEKRNEIIGGHIFMVPAPTPEHQDISRNIEKLILNFVEKNSLGKVYYAPIDVILDDTNIVQPDLLFISKEKIQIINKSKGIEGAPDLVLEIISKYSKYRDRYEKKELYQKFKVKEYWIVDPYSKSIEVLSLNENGIYELLCEGWLEDEEYKGNKQVSSKILDGFILNLEDAFTF